MTDLDNDNKITPTDGEEVQSVSTDKQAETTAKPGKNKRFAAGFVARFAVLLALVIVLQVWGSTIKIGATSISLVLIPIVLGGLVLGPLAGAALGFAFGLITLIAGIIGADPFTLILFQAHPVLTAALCLVKGTAAGFVSALLYRAIKRKNEYEAVFAASASAPVVNTGLFVLGALLMTDTLRANFVSDGTTVIYFLVIVCAGWNFLLEFCLNIVVTPALYRLQKIFRKSTAS